jgi:hypothetical protein
MEAEIPISFKPWCHGSPKGISHVKRSAGTSHDRNLFCQGIQRKTTRKNTEKLPSKYRIFSLKCRWATDMKLSGYI